MIHPVAKENAAWASLKVVADFQLVFIADLGPCHFEGSFKPSTD
jgi:hypothetical protein